MHYLDLLKETEQKKLLIDFSLLTNSSILLLDEKKKIIFNINSKNKNNKIDLGNKLASLPKDYQKLLINLFEQKKTFFLFFICRIFFKGRTFSYKQYPLRRFIFFLPNYFIFTFLRTIKIAYAIFKKLIFSSF